MNSFTCGSVRSLLAAAIACTFAVAEADAEQECGQFVLSPSGKTDLFAGYVPAFESGDVLPIPGTFALRLKPATRVIYSYKSAHDHDSGYGGVVAIESIPPGRHRIALSGEARVDAAQGNALLRLQAIAHDPECPGVHSSVEIVSEGGALIVQISGARLSLMTIAVFRVSRARVDRPLGFAASSAFIPHPAEKRATPIRCPACPSECRRDVARLWRGRRLAGEAELTRQRATSRALFSRPASSLS